MTMKLWMVFLCRLSNFNTTLHNRAPAKIYTKRASQNADFHLSAQSEATAQSFNREGIILYPNSCVQPYSQG